MWPPLERAGRYTKAAYVDLRLLITGKRDADLPPLRLRFVGDGDFRAVGEHLLELTKTRGLLGPSSRVLDIGCGSGRLAIPLTKYLVSGEYEGFDVVNAAIRWCTRHVTKRHANFHFKHVSLKNSDYSFRGEKAANFVFPYRESRFDCVVAYSLFTHLTWEEMRNYIRQSYRVLSPGGRLIGTFFMLNQASEAAQRENPDVLQFRYGEGPVRFVQRENPAFAVAVREDALVAFLRDCGFEPVSVDPGCWYGQQKTVTFQDLVVCRKS